MFESRRERSDWHMPERWSVCPMVLLCALLVGLRSEVHAEANEPLRALIVDGRNNHEWSGTTHAIRQILLQTGRFEVDVSTAPSPYGAPRPSRPRSDASEDELRAYQAAMAEFHAAAKRYEASIADKWENWRPAFSDYDVVVDNYNGPEWLLPVKADLVEFLHGGGGMVVVHGANNAFPNWIEFNRMIGIGWRKKHQGIAITVDDETGKMIANPVGEGRDSAHGSKHAFVVKTRAPEHPITKGLPEEWLHGRDELYHAMRGPAKNLKILATAFSSPDQRGTGQHEPILWTTEFGKGRVVTTSMGHMWPGANGPQGRDSLHCVGFQTVMARSCEWAAGEPVTLDVPPTFPKPNEKSIVHPEFVHWTAGGRTLPLAPQAIEDPAERAVLKKDRNPYALLTPEESIASMQLPDGYEMQLVVAEPHVREPVLAVWDGNGRLYVAEMRSYMQDEYGTDTKRLRNGRISRHEDTNGDGELDRHTVFVDGLNLPRMLLPLDDRVAVVETDSTAITAYRDTDGDGRANEKTVLYPGSRKIDPSRSVEHQDSGLVWSIDNWIYLSRGRERYRFTNGEWRTEPIQFDWNQWGLDQDDTGRLFFNENSKPIKSFQQHPIYWNQIAKRAKGRWTPPSLEPDYAPDFLTLHSICEFGDRGGPHASRSFTSATGGSVLRGNGLGEDVYGDHFVCDPTGHVVRRATLERAAGKIVVRNAYEKDRKEFLASTDINFRPVSTTTGPDGALYVVDMYRGMIQDAPWVNDGMKVFLRRSGLNANIHNGRIYRIVERGRRLPRPPQLLDTPTAELPQHLARDNGWIRDTTQKLIVLREDRDTVLEALRTMATEHDKPLARLHALWTLEGSNAVDRETLLAGFKDPDWRVREGAVRIGERLLVADTDWAWTAIEAMAAEDDPNVARQLVLSLGCCDSPKAVELIDRIVGRHLTNEVVYLSAMTSLHGRHTPMIKRIASGAAFRTIKDAGLRVNTQRRWTTGIANWEQQTAPTRPLSPEDVKLVERGYEIYAQLCINCHGGDGRGVRLPGQDPKAPPLVGSPRVLGQPQVLGRILLHGLTGPVDEKTYREVMAPSDKHDDEWIAAVLSYIRQDWGNLASIVRPEDVAAVRKASRGRYRAWTMKELEDYAFPELTDRSAWRAESTAGGSAAKAINGKSDSCDNPNQPGRWVRVDLGSPHTITSIRLTASNKDRYPRQWELRVSADGESWSEAVANGQGDQAVTTITVEPTLARVLEVRQTGTDPHHRWSVTDFAVFGAAGDVRGSGRTDTAERPPTPEELVTLPGDAARGAKVFGRTCIKCHVVGGKGTNFGPDLTKVATRLKKPLLVQSILEPDAVVEPKFRGELLVTSEGKIVSGFVTATSPDTITVRAANGVVHELSVDDVEERRPLTKSFMPSGLERTMSRRELLDLLAYLESLR